MSGWNPNATFVRTEILKENGRWAVYLEVDFYEPDADGDQKFQTVRHRIQDYPKERLARIAAEWIRRAAERDIPDPPGGF
ncbi:MAG: hypothetical protein QNJ45_10285 [Ardenticatenaceae bacterium]|nr:hypothetical protein [Ardenticatenaceae bacterium]